MDKKEKVVLVFFIMIINLSSIPNNYNEYINGDSSINILTLVITTLLVVNLFINILRKNNDKIIANIIIIPIINILNIYFFRGYQFLNTFSFIILILIVILNKKQISISYKENKSLLLLLFLYTMMFISSCIGIIFNEKNDNSIYWILIALVNIANNLIFIILLSRKLGFNMKLCVEKLYCIFLGISLSCILRFFIGSIIFNINILDSLRFKRIFTYVGLSTSNYTIGIIIIIYFYLKSNQKYLLNKQSIIIDLVMVISLIFSNSRTSIIAWCIVILCNFVLNKNMNKKTILIVLTIVFFVALFGTNELIENVVGRFQRAEYNDSNISTRFEFFHMYKEDFIESNSLYKQIFGQGLGQGVNLEVKRPHNIYILCINQLGIVGLIFLLFVYLYIFINNKKLRSLIAYILIASIFEPIIFTLAIDFFLCYFVFLELKLKKE